MARRSPPATYADGAPEDGPYGQSLTRAATSNFLSMLHRTLQVYDSHIGEVSPDSTRSRTTTEVRNRPRRSKGTSRSLRTLPEEDPHKPEALEETLRATGARTTHASGRISNAFARPDEESTSQLSRRTTTAPVAIPFKENGKVFKSDGTGGCREQRVYEHYSRQERAPSEMDQMKANAEKHSGARRKTCNPPRSSKKQNDRSKIETMKKPSNENKASHMTSQCRASQSELRGPKMESKSTITEDFNFHEKRTLGTSKTLSGSRSENRSPQISRKTSSNVSSTMHDIRKSSGASGMSEAMPSKNRSCLTPNTMLTNKNVCSQVTSAASRTSGANATSKAVQNGRCSLIPPKVPSNEHSPCPVTDVRAGTTGTPGARGASKPILNEARSALTTHRKMTSVKTYHNRDAGVAFTRPGTPRTRPGRDRTPEMPRTGPVNKANRPNSSSMSSGALSTKPALNCNGSPKLTHGSGNSGPVRSSSHLGYTRASASGNLDNSVVSRGNAGSGSITFTFGGFLMSTPANTNRSTSSEKCEGSTLSQSASETLSFVAEGDSTPPGQTIGADYQGGRAPRLPRMPRAGRDASEAKDSASSLPGPISQGNEGVQHGRFVEIVIAGKEKALPQNETVRHGQGLKRSEERPPNSARRRHCAGDVHPVERDKRVTNGEAANRGEKPLENICQVMQQMLSEEECRSAVNDDGSRRASEIGRSSSSFHSFRLIPVPRNVGSLVDPSELLRLLPASNENSRRKANSSSPQSERGNISQNDRAVRREEQVSERIRIPATPSESNTGDVSPTLPPPPVSTEGEVPRYCQLNSSVSPPSPDLLSATPAPGDSSSNDSNIQWDMINPGEHLYEHEEMWDLDQEQPVMEGQDRDSDAVSVNQWLNSSSDSDSEEQWRDLGTLRRLREITALGRPSNPIANILSCHDSQHPVFVYLPCARLHDLRRHFLEALLVYFPEVQRVGGVRAIPFMQVGIVCLPASHCDDHCILC